MPIKRTLIVAALLGFALATPAPARADWIFTPFVGGVFGGDTPASSVSFGADIGYMGAGAVGFEVDFNVAPNFYKDTTTAFDGNVTSLMANVIVGAPIGGTHGIGVRPYVSGGAGLLRSRVDDAGQFFGQITSNDWGIDVGGGVMGFLSDNVGLRGDIRYFRDLQDRNAGNGVDLGLGKFDFWRATGGVTFRF
jgi:Outer membrane protein beta-barrel domain